MEAPQTPNWEHLRQELERLCGKVGYIKGGTGSLDLVPGLARLTIVGGPELPRSPAEWQERREALRAVLDEITVNEVYGKLGPAHEFAAFKVFRLDLTEPVDRQGHPSLGPIYEGLNMLFGMAQTGTGFRIQHRPELFEVIAKALVAREDAHREQTEGDSGEESKTIDPAEPPDPREDDDERRAGGPEQAKRSALVLGGVVTATFILLAGLVSALSILGNSGAAAFKKQIVDDVPNDGSLQALRKVHLHDAATPSYFVVVRRPPPRQGTDAQSWDEVRIYDANGPDAELRFAAQPVALIGGAPTVRAWGGTAGNTTGRMYRFQLLGIHDTNADGRAEIFGGFRDQISSVIRPVAIAWDAATDRYELLPLIPDQPEAPVWGEVRPGLGVASWARRESRMALKVYVRPDDRHPALYGATEVAVQRSSGLGWLFVSGYAATSGSKSVSLEGSGVRADRSGQKFNHQFAFGRKPAINRLTVEVARLRDSDGTVRPEPCKVYASARIGPDLTVPVLMVSAFGKEPLAPRRLNLAELVLC